MNSSPSPLLLLLDPGLRQQNEKPTEKGEGKSPRGFSICGREDEEAKEEEEEEEQ